MALGSTQGHPYFVTYVMHYAFQAAIDAGWPVLTHERLNAIWSSILARLDHGKFRDDWESATPGEQKTLVKVAQGHLNNVN